MKFPVTIYLKQKDGKTQSAFGLFYLYEITVFVLLGGAGLILHYINCDNLILSLKDATKLKLFADKFDIYSCEKINSPPGTIFNITLIIYL